MNLHYLMECPPEADFTTALFWWKVLHLNACFFPFHRFTVKDSYESSVSERGVHTDSNAVARDYERYSKLLNAVARL